MCVSENQSQFSAVVYFSSTLIALLGPFLGAPRLTLAFQTHAYVVYISSCIEWTKYGPFPIYRKYGPFFCLNWKKRGLLSFRRGCCRSAEVVDIHIACIRVSNICIIYVAYISSCAELLENSVHFPIWFKKKTRIWCRFVKFRRYWYWYCWYSRFEHMYMSRVSSYIEWMGNTACFLVWIEKRRIFVVL